MSADPASSTLATSGMRFSAPLALLLWLALQLGTLALAASQVRLSDHFPRPAEGMALAEMVVVQIAGAAMLAPILLPRADIAVAVIAAGWPMLQLAGLLSVASTTTILLTATYISLWIIILAALMRCIDNDRWRIAVAVMASV